MKASDYYRELDKLTALGFENNPVKPCCSKGCHTCCSEALTVADAEVKNILEHYPPEKLDALKARTADWMESFRPFQRAPTKDGLINGFAYLLADIKCPFLEGGLCSIYEHRPFSCRVYFAAGNPEHCKMPHRITQQIADYNYTDPRFATGYFDTMMNEGSIRMDHLGVLLYNRLFDQNELTSVSVLYEF